MKKNEPRRRGYCQACYIKIIMSGTQTRSRSLEMSRLAKGRPIEKHSQPRRYTLCGSCNKFKSRPSSVCEYCGDDPVGNVSGSVGATETNRFQYDQAMGWD